MVFENKKTKKQQILFSFMTIILESKKLNKKTLEKIH